MNTIEIRKELHAYIDNSTDNIVEAIYAMLKTYNNEHLDDVDIDEYNKDINEAMKEMDKGNYTTHEEAKIAILNDAGK